MMTAAGERLAELAARYDLPTQARDSLARLLELLAADAAAPTAVTNPAEAVDVHVADSLVALEIPGVRAARTVADIGSGAGLPGLPLAAALPDARVWLVEATRRKCDFLERAVAATDLVNATTVCARAEEWEQGREACDLVTARALAPLAVVAEYAAPLLRIGGALVAWKGRRDAAEERAAAAAAANLGLTAPEALRVRPYRDARDRHLHRLVKLEPTPPRFPRRAGMARKRPLCPARSEDFT